MKDVISYDNKSGHSSKFYKKKENNSYVQVCTISKFKRLSIKEIWTWNPNRPKYDLLSESMLWTKSLMV